MKKLIIILLIACIRLANAQSLAPVPVQYVSISDANLLPEMLPSSAFYKVQRVYGQDLQATYYFKYGVPSSPLSSFLASMHLNIVSTYPGVTGYWTTEKNYEASSNVVFFDKSMNRLISLADMYKADSILRKADSLRLSLQTTLRKADSIRINGNTESIALKANTNAISAVGFSGSYNDLANKPSIPPALTAGSNISIVGNAINNTAPNQVVSITAGTGISVTGAYPNFTISAVQPTIATPTRTVNTNFTPSATKSALVFYSVLCTVTNPLLAGNSTATVTLQYSNNGGSTWIDAAQIGNQSAVGVAVAIQITNGQTGEISAVIPANALVRLNSVTSGTASVSVVKSTEIVY